VISLKNLSRASGCSSVRVAMAALLLLGISAARISPDQKDKPATGRMLTGKVLDKHDNPIVNSVVYLSNTRTHAVTSYIVGPDGSYQFPQLSPNVDYEVYAQYQGRKSDTKTVSQFDDRRQVNIVLRIDLPK
jgi:Carboxypeptidase regulatory-like domain